MIDLRFIQGQVREIPEDVEFSRTIEFIISTATRDRHGTVLNPENWQLDNFNRNGIVGYQHNVYGKDLCSGPDPDAVIGIGKAWQEDHKLIGSVRFEPREINPLAEKIFRKVIHGTLKATSVGFYPIGEGRYGEGEERRGGSNETFYFDGQELLEFSIVNIPSNPDAVRRSLATHTDTALEFLHRHLNGKYSRQELLNMRIQDVIHLAEGREVTPMQPDPDTAAQIQDLRRQLDKAERLKNYYKLRASYGLYGN